MTVEFWEDSDLSPLEALLATLQGLSPGEKILEMKVDEDEGLVEGDNAYTWVPMSTEKSGRLAWCMKDDDGEFELDTYDLTLEGVDSALSQHFDRQCQCSWAEYEALIKEKRFK